MHRFFCSSPHLSEGKILLDDINQIHHLKNVLRLKEKNNLVIFDSKGNEYDSVIEKLSMNNVTLAVKKVTKSAILQRIAIAIACAVPKKSKFEDVVDKLTQLDVEKIIPLMSERVIVKIDDSKRNSRLERWRKVALSASQQSQRSSLPLIDNIRSFNDVIAESGDFDLKLIPTLEGERKTLSSVISKSGLKSVLVLIGPEGDFTPEEVKLAKTRGFIPITLGASVLRVETAAVAVASFLRLSFL